MNNTVLKMKTKIATVLAIMLATVSVGVMVGNAAIVAEAANYKSVVSRDDGIIMFPLDASYYTSISDFAGCNSAPGVHGSCPLDGCKQPTCGANHVSGKRGHQGMDIGVGSYGTVNAYAAVSGTVHVLYSGYSTARGRTVAIEQPIGDGRSRYYVYQHLDSISVKNGSYVNMGATIGKVGGSGNGSLKGYKAHLHFAAYLYTSGGLNINDAENYGWVTDYSKQYGILVTNPSVKTLTTYKLTNLETCNKHAGSFEYIFVSGIKYPSGILKKGSSFGLRGIIAGNSINYVYAYIDDHNRNMCRMYNVAYGHNVDIRYSDINNKINFSELQSGEYTYVLGINCNGKNITLVSQTFTIR